MNAANLARQPDPAHAGSGAAAQVPAHVAPSRPPAPAGPGTASEPASASPDRRQGDRRTTKPDRAFDAPVTRLDSEQWFPRSWPYLILAMVIAVGIAFAVTRMLPGAVTMGCIAAAVISVSLVGPAHRLVGRNTGTMRLVSTIVVVLGPLFLFGLGMTHWASSDDLPGDALIAVLLSVGITAAVYLRRQPGMIFATQLAIWSAALIASFSFAGFFGLLVAGGLALLVSREQNAEQRREEMKRAAQERIQTRARDILADYESTGQGWFWETDRRSLLTYVSAPVARIIGRDPERLVGQPLVQLFDLGDTDEENERTLMFHLSTRSAFKELAVRAATEREERWWSISGRPIYDSYNNFVGFRGSGTDLTERKRSQEEASRLANYDSLTGLANRFQIMQVLEKILRSQQQANRACAIFLLDLDRFKQVAQRLERAVGKMGKVGRLGGDEFKVIVHGKRERPMLAQLAQEIIHSLSQPYAIEGQRVIIGASIGIAVSPDDGESSDELIRNADLALYAAKDGGRGRYHFYAQDLHADAEARAQLEEDLRDAIAKGDLQLFYQPVVSTATEKITGFEALLRWQHPVKGWIPPTRFIQTAEDTGLIAQLGEWALRTACHDLADMNEDVRVAVNVSPLQFANPQLPSIVTNAIAQAGVRPEQLELEITESVFLSDDEGTDAMFAALKNIGVRLALDDFGTGYSSLGYLKKAPFDKIKIDQSFVRGATEEGSRNGAIIASITSLAHSLNMETTAEGVETLDELDLIRSLGCSHVQGFIYERPLDAESAKQRLETGLAAVARGPRSARAPRQTMLRKVVLDHAGNQYNGTIRNISSTGAMIEGLWNVPVGTIFKVRISENFQVTCTARWCEEDRMGVEFANPLQRDNSGRIVAVQGAAPPPVVRKLVKKAG